LTREISVHGTPLLGKGGLLRRSGVVVVLIEIVEKGTSIHGTPLLGKGGLLRRSGVVVVLIEIVEKGTSIL